MFKIYDTIGKVWTLVTHIPNMDAQSLGVRKLSPMIKGRSIVKVKVTRSKMVPLESHVIRSLFAKYESPIF